MQSDPVGTWEALRRGFEASLWIKGGQFGELGIWGIVTKTGWQNWSNILTEFLCNFLIYYGIYSNFEPIFLTNFAVFAVFPLKISNYSLDF